MHVCIVEHQGQTQVHKNIDAHPNRFLPLKLEEAHTEALHSRGASLCQEQKIEYYIPVSCEWWRSSPMRTTQRGRPPSRRTA
jgi:hypothetical protein